MTRAPHSWIEAEELAFGWVAQDVTGHDRFHLERVRSMAIRLAKSVGADLTIVEWAALFHDALDSKLVDATGDRKNQINALMSKHGLSPFQIHSIWEIIEGQSFSKSLPSPANSNTQLETGRPSLEFQAVQDADRLDAIGAIGMARCFAYGAKHEQPIHHPEWKPRGQLSIQEYRQGKQSSLNHFYEKLLLLRDRMHTPMARLIAEKRQARMESFLKDFLLEWAGEDERVEGSA